MQTQIDEYSARDCVIVYNKRYSQNYSNVCPGVESFVDDSYFFGTSYCFTVLLKYVIWNENFSKKFIIFFTDFYLEISFEKISDKLRCIFLSTQLELFYNSFFLSM